MTIRLLSFGQALKASANYGKRHLLLGNGISIASPTLDVDFFDAASAKVWG